MPAIIEPFRARCETFMPNGVKERSSPRYYVRNLGRGSDGKQCRILIAVYFLPENYAVDCFARALDDFRREHNLGNIVPTQCVSFPVP